MSAAAPQTPSPPPAPILAALARMDLDNLGQPAIDQLRAVRAELHRTIDALDAILAAQHRGPA